MSDPSGVDDPIANNSMRYRQVGRVVAVVRNSIVVTAVVCRRSAVSGEIVGLRQILAMSLVAFVTGAGSVRTQARAQAARWSAN
jgi:hypothetical protein